MINFVCFSGVVISIFPFYKTSRYLPAGWQAIFKNPN
jgi:hypothetical protein